MDEKTRELLAKQEEKIKNFSDNILKFMQNECLKENYSDVDLYLAVQYLIARIEHSLGKTRTAQIKKSFQIVPLDDCKKC